jgi:hypothetical protein
MLQMVAVPDRNTQGGDQKFPAGIFTSQREANAVGTSFRLRTMLTPRPAGAMLRLGKGGLDMEDVLAEAERRLRDVKSVKRVSISTGGYGHTDEATIGVIVDGDPAEHEPEIFRLLKGIGAKISVRKSH